MPHPIVRRMVVGLAASVFSLATAVLLGILTVFGCLVIWVAGHVNSRMPVIGPFSISELAAGRQFTPQPAVLPRPSPEVERGWPTVTPNATLVALHYAEGVDYVVQALRETWTLPMTVSASTLLPEQARSLGLTAEQVSWGSVPDVALLLESESRSGRGRTVLIWDAQYSSVVAEHSGGPDSESPPRHWRLLGGDLNWALVATPSWREPTPGR